MHDKRTVRAVILHPDGRVLLIERHKKNQHYFVLPGGHLKVGEMPQQAVIREVKEETGLEASIERLLFRYIDGLENQVTIYLCHKLSGKPLLLPQSPEARHDKTNGQLHRPDWFRLEEVQHKITYPGNLIELVEPLIR